MSELTESITSRIFVKNYEKVRHMKIMLSHLQSVDTDIQSYTYRPYYGCKDNYIFALFFEKDLQNLSVSWND